ncbi:MAG: AarF/ABC1/UbiB kinase family protein [Thermoanaerobaculia bacterium]|nr:AarF/ABC1/UbiB kinase family protein [Thermoanaerobaculia bacterium]
MADERRERPLVTSPTRRLLRLGGLVGRVGASVAGERTLELLRSGPGREAQRLDNLVKNALRIVETLGEMRGAAMKVGQMLSLHEGLLPPEVNAVLSRLQREAPRVPPEVMRYEIEGSLGAPIEELFEEFEEEAFAAASIGQVHAARMADGRRVAVKVQYPLIREVVTADLKNMKTLFKSLFSLVFDAGFEPLWEEVRDRLLEELDYEHEADNIRRLADLHADVPEIVIPHVVAERSTDRVLTMELVEGLSPAEAAGDGVTQELRDRWGQVLFEFQMRGLLAHRMMHTDPNLANFAFREDGRVVVYDFGSVKRVPAELARRYGQLAAALLDDRRAEIPGILAAIGATRGDGSPLDLEVLDPYVDLLAEILRAEPPYTFGEDPELYDKVMALGMQNWAQATDMRFPRDVIFIDRSLAGHLGNLIRLRATGPWAGILARYAARGD